MRFLHNEFIVRHTSDYSLLSFVLLLICMSCVVLDVSHRGRVVMLASDVAPTNIGSAECVILPLLRCVGYDVSDVISIGRW